MTIVFLCGSLEPGRDGVGDYVRRLSAELLSRGHEVSIMSVNDPYIDKIFIDEQIVNSRAISIIRIPSCFTPNNRYTSAHQWIHKINPDWISLQYVPYSFHAKGLPFDLGSKLAKLGKGRLWHIMFHELWIGMDSQASLKHKWLGGIQRFIIKSLVSQLRPKVIHTHAELYQNELAQLGILAKPLQLFGNIAVGNSAIDNKPDSDQISLVLFGGIHPHTPIQQFANEAAQYARHIKSSIKLVIIGRCGKETDVWEAAWKAVDLPVEVLGEQSPAYISSTLHKATLGLATTPAALIEKSGTTAAMLEHGLGIICVSREWNPKNIFNLKTHSNIATYKPGNFDSCINLKPDKIPSNTVERIANQLLISLNK